MGLIKAEAAGFRLILGAKASDFKAQGLGLEARKEFLKLGKHELDT